MRGTSSIVAGFEDEKREMQAKECRWSPKAGTGAEQPASKKQGSHCCMCKELSSANNEWANSSAPTVLRKQHSSNSTLILAGENCVKPPHTELPGIKFVVLKYQVCGSLLW